MDEWKVRHDGIFAKLVILAIWALAFYGIGYVFALAASK